MKKSKSKRPKASEDAVENLIASALAQFACARSGLPGFGSIEAAEQSLLEVLELDPRNLEALNLLAQSCAQTDRHEEAWSYFLKALDFSKTPKDAIKLACALAEAYEGQKDAEAYRRAIRIYGQALSRREDPSLHDGIGYCYGKISCFADSVRHHRRAVELAPGNAKILSDLGYSLIELGELEEAESVLLRALALDPADELTQGNLEHCRELMAVKKG